MMKTSARRNIMEENEKIQSMERNGFGFSVPEKMPNL